MNEYQDIEKLKQDLFSRDRKISWDAMLQMSSIKSDDSLQYFISMLDASDPQIRNLGANGLMYMEDNRAVEPLIAAIFKNGSDKDAGSLTAALTFLDCSQKLKEIFEILFYYSYESKIHASEILGSQIFEFYKQDIVDIQQMWEDLRSHPERSRDHLDGSFDLINNMVEAYLPYLNDSLE